MSNDNAIRIEGNEIHTAIGTRIVELIRKVHEDFPKISTPEIYAACGVGLGIVVSMAPTSEDRQSCRDSIVLSMDEAIRISLAN